MNKSLKAKNLPLFSIIDLDQLRRENHLEGTVVTVFFTARYGKVCLLMEQPSETQGKDWLSIPSTYTAVEIQLDWAEQRVLETTLFPLGLLKFQFHYLRPAGEHFLLLGARCAYRENGPDQNAWIVSRDGAVLSRFCLGDGIHLDQKKQRRSGEDRTRHSLWKGRRCREALVQNERAARKGRCRAF